MTVLSPTNLETTDYGQQGWNAVHSANMQRLNAFIAKLWGPTTAAKALGTDTVSDVPAQTAQALTDSTGGAASQTLTFFTQEEFENGTWKTILANNFASLTDEVNKLRADNDQLRTALSTLLLALRKTAGCGVLNG